MCSRAVGNNFPAAFLFTPSVKILSCFLIDFLNLAYLCVFESQDG